MLSRRTFLGAALAAVPKDKTLPADRVRYADPLTEFTLLRLTDPSYASFLPRPKNDPVSRRDGFLLYAGDRTGSLQALRMDLKTGESAVLTEAAQLRPWSVTLLPGERSFCFLGGASLFQAPLTSLKPRLIYQVPAEYECTDLVVADDGNDAFLIERKGVASRIRRVPLGRGLPATVVEAPTLLLDAIPRPRRAGVLYRRAGDTLWLVNYDGQQNRRLRTAPGACHRAVWSPDGRSVLYLNLQNEPKPAVAIREHIPDTNADTLVSVTSAYTDFDRNADGSVFIGVGGSKAQPHVLLLVRAVKRELTLCEHKATDPDAVAAQFSPSSKRVFFQSDRHGKPAIYMMAVDRLVETTES